MSWDLFVMKLPPGLKEVEDLPGDFQPPLIGTRDGVIAEIRKIAPEADFSNPEWGIIEGADFSIEISLGKEVMINSFALHVRGVDAAILNITRILDQLGLGAIDCQTSRFFEPGPAAIESLRMWREFRNRSVEGTPEP